MTNEEPQYNVITHHSTVINGKVLKYSVCYNYIAKSNESNKEPDMVFDYRIPYKRKI